MDVEAVRWYTRARRFPQLIARTPDGTRLPGGPYSIHQVVAAAVVLIAGYKTMGVWARFGFITNVVLLLGGTWAVAYAIGKIPIGARSPITVATGAVQSVIAPTRGRHRGKPVRIRRPQRVRHHLILATPPPAAAIADAAPATPQPAAPVVSVPQPPADLARAAAGHAPPLTGVQLLLAGRRPS